MDRGKMGDEGRNTVFDALHGEVAGIPKAEAAVEAGAKGGALDEEN